MDTATTSTATSNQPGREAGRPWPVPDAARFLGVSERHVWRMVEAGKAKSIRFGRRVLLPDAEVQRLASEGG